MNRSPSLTSQIKAANPELRGYVLELEKENLRLHKQIAKLEAKDVSQQNQIIALKKAQPKLNIVIKKYGEDSADKKKEKQK